MRVFDLGGIAQRVSRRTLLVGMALALTGSVAVQAQDTYEAPPADGPQIQLRLSSNAVGVSPMAKILPELLEEFQADYPNVSITYEGTPAKTT